MPVYSNTISLSLEPSIVACSERVQVIARAFARSCNDWRVEADELYSVAMLRICEVVAAGGLANVKDPVAYLYGVARKAMLEEWRRLRGWSSTASLDAPLFDDDSAYTLHDVVPAPVPAPAAPDSTSMSRALYKALDRLPARQRLVVRRRFGLPGYGTHDVGETAKALRASKSAAMCLAYRGVRNLGTDVALCKAVEVAR